MCTVVVYIGSLAVYFMDFMRCSCGLGPRNRWTTHLFQMLHNVLYILICICVCVNKNEMKPVRLGINNSLPIPNISRICGLCGFFVDRPLSLLVHARGKATFAEQSSIVYKAKNRKTAYGE